MTSKNLGTPGLSENVSNSVNVHRNPWLGEWTYIIKNQVHSFDITYENGKLCYSEDMGPTTIKGKVTVDEVNNTARIIAKSMNFEIDINRESMVARYRTRGSEKWTKKISLMKVDEIEEQSDSEAELSWNKSTLRNTWKNQSLRDESAKFSFSDGECDFKADSMRGSSIRKMNSMRVTKNQSKSMDSCEVDELFKKNTTRRSIRFAEDELNDLIAEVLEDQV